MRILAECYICKKKVRFVRKKGENPICCNAKPVYVRRDPKGNCYFNIRGEKVFGLEVLDGLQVFSGHRCR